MVAYNFQARFVPMIEKGRKRHTIRGHRKRHAQPGETVRLQYGSRFKPVLLGFATCTGVHSIRLNFTTNRVSILHADLRGKGSLDWFVLYTRELVDAFAKSDGFADWQDMRAFWMEFHNVSEFEGNLIRWGYPLHD